MRFWVNFLVAIVSLGATSTALALRSNFEPPILEGGGGPIPPAGLNAQCIARLKYNIMICKQDPGPIASNACRGALDEDPTCVANACMRSKNYPLGLDTDPAVHCITGIPRHAGPTQSDEDTADQGVNNDAFKRPSRTTPTVETPKNAPTPTSRPDRETANNNSGNWQQESARDIQQCTSADQQANQCCNNPNSCSSELNNTQKKNYAEMARAAQGRGDTQGLKQICSQAREDSASSSSINTGFANICFSKHSSCTQSCGNALTKWQQRLNNCGANCDRSLVSNTVNQLTGRKNSCQGYARLEDQIRSQSFAAAEDTALSNMCAQTSSTEDGQQQDELIGRVDGGGGGGGFALPDLSGLAGAFAPAPQQPRQEEPIALSPQSPCLANPNGPGCYQANPTTGGVTAPIEGTSSTPTDFNVGTDNNFDSTNDGTTYDPSGSIQPQQQSAHAIQNGGGGFIGGGGGGGGASTASAGSGSDLPAMLGSGVNPNSKTDILDGTTGGGGYSQAGAPSAGSGFENKYGAINMNLPQTQGAQDPNYKGLDLKRFLPGGKEDPRRNLAGVSAFHPDIGPMHVDFFQRVSTRLQTLCKLKRLLDCQ